MKAHEIRGAFLDYFRERGHEVRPSSSLVPANDPTLLFTNSGMVQFKRVFLGQEDVPYRRAVTSQKCVRAGGKHNDLEEVGRTTRHHTFFEMLGNFSFGDYFKRDAIVFAWELLTDVYGLDADRLYASVHHSDDEAAELWQNEVGLEPARIYRLGDADNFWQMADTGPCGPCSELHYDVRSSQERTGGAPSSEAFEALAEAGSFVELWNLVFMQFDRDAEGVLTPLPAPSIDTGAGLERLTATLQGADSVFHTDLFAPLLDRVASLVGRPYVPDDEHAVSYRVLVDHARAVAFLLADGVFPSNEGRGYVLRRILRRAVRHAWLLERREPTLVDVVDIVIDTMAGAFPELAERREHLLRTTTAEEERFLSTIEGGLRRFDVIAPGGVPADERVIPGDEAFRLYDTFGFPLDLTQLMAEERGYDVDSDGFERALEEQRSRSRADRERSMASGPSDQDLGSWHVLDPERDQEFVGYQTLRAETDVLAIARNGDSVALQLAENPFYAEAGGQVSDVGSVEGDGWRLSVADVRRVGSAVAVVGRVEGDAPSTDVRPLRVVGEVRPEERHDTERNHTATHLLHAALRSILGDHVVQRGSLVAPDRLRFDFSHPAPLTDEERCRVERFVNDAVWADHPVRLHRLGYDEAVARGAMALFGEKYDEVVRVVEVPSVSLELCGGTHVRHTAEVGLFKIVSESGVAAGVRRIEAQTGPGALAYLEERIGRMEEAARVMKTRPDNIVNRAGQLVDEVEQLEGLLAELRQRSGSAEEVVGEADVDLSSGESFSLRVARLRALDADDARTWGDAFRDRASSAVGLIGVSLPDEKHALFAFVTDDLIGRGLRADAIVREVAAVAGGRGGGRPHMAQAGVPDEEGLVRALAAAEGVVRALVAGEGA